MLKQLSKAILIIFFVGFGLSAEESLKNRMLTIVPGEHYFHTKWFGIVPVKLIPQIAVWVESETGEYRETLYITEQSALDRWKGAESRPEALPVYSHLIRHEPEGTVNTVSAASSRKGLENRNILMPWTEETLVIRAEVNASFDYNALYTRKNSGVNGQPSLIYSGFWRADEVSVTLTLMGTGDVTGCSGTIQEDLTGITTAHSIIEYITVKRE